jgi:branched-chain amino acid transport system substrate-binding protein
MTNRRDLLKAATAGALALGFPAIVRAQSNAIKIGHLTPLTGFLGALERGAVFHQGLARPLLTDLQYRKEILWL